MLERMQRGRHADLVDVELGRLVRMPVNDRRDLRDHLAGTERHEHMMAGLRQVGGETARIHALIKNRVRDPVEQRDIAGFDLPDLEFHRRHLRAHSPPSARRRRHHPVCRPRQPRRAGTLQHDSATRGDQDAQT